MDKNKAKRENGQREAREWQVPLLDFGFSTHASSSSSLFQNVEPFYSDESVMTFLI
jgi:hypothetical protein